MFLEHSVDWRIVVVVAGNVLHYVKREKEIVRAGYVPGEYVQIPVMGRSFSSSLIVLLLLLLCHRRSA